MCEVYAISMNKGGVGKTSLVTNLAGAIAKEFKKRILIIDTDGQGNTSIAFGLKPHDFDYTIYDVLVGEKPAKEVIVRVDKYIDILPSNNDMNFLEFDILPNIQQYAKPFKLLKNTLDSVKDSYDYIFIDTRGTTEIRVKMGHMLEFIFHFLHTLEMLQLRVLISLFIVMVRLPYLVLLKRIISPGLGRALKLTIMIVVET
jgi:cellulose biosynthesis protein BcsQ